MAEIYEIKNLLNAHEVKETYDLLMQQNWNINTISQSEAFQTVKQQSPARHSTIELRAWERQNRKLNSVDASNRFAGVLNARSVPAIRTQLDLYKQDLVDSTKLRRKNQILSLLDSITDSKEDADAETPEVPINGTNFADTNPKPTIDMKFMAEAYCKAMHQCGNLREFDARTRRYVLGMK